MKKVFLQIGAMLFLSASLSLGACNGNSDKKIQSEFNDKAKANPQLSTITASVNDGVVTLNGACPNETCRSSAEQTARDVKGVKNVVNNITVTQEAPVVIADDATLKNSVDEIIDDYKDVSADVQNGEITLRGSITRENLQKLMMELNATSPKKINNQLTIK